MSKNIFLYLLIFNALALQAQVIDYDYVPDFTYEEVADRLSCIETTIPLHYNLRVKGFIDYFTVRDRDYTREILNRKDYYFDIFEPVLSKYNMPDEIKYLAVVESGLRSNAVSHANAVGLWQFIHSTGKIYGLNNNWYIDDRMDPLLATDAACRHLTDLYRMFNDWELALAAYNCGPGNVRKAIKRSGYKKDFWEIFNYLPRETRSYVPQFVAIIYALNYAEEHNLYPEKPFSLPKTDTIQVSQYLHLETFSALSGICMEDLLALNPAVKRGAIPDGFTNFPLNIPLQKLAQVKENRVVWFDSAGKVGKEQLEYLSRNTPGSVFGREKIIYKVRSGDVLGSVAQKHHVTIADIKKWNNFSSNTIYIGQNLNIWVLPTYSSTTKSTYTASAQSTTTSMSITSGIYKVQPGDTLWGISKSSNISVEQIKSMNNLTSNVIQPGQSLILRK